MRYHLIARKFLHAKYEHLNHQRNYLYINQENVCLGQTNETLM